MNGAEGKANGLTAGIIIIGDEILKGHVQDTNSHYLCHQLWLLGIKVGKITVVSDDLDSIAEEVKRFSAAYDYVLTTGGIGPTHDDVTLEAVGKAFGEEMYPHPDMLKLFFGDAKKDDPSNPWRKMVIVPKSTKMHIRPIPSGEFSYLLFAVHNVHCYPGVPSLLKGGFQICKDLYSQSTRRFYLKEVFFSCDEDILAKPLSQLQQEFSDVQVGSYPDMSPMHNYCVRVTLESDNKQQVKKAYSRLVLLLPIGVLLYAQDHYSSEDSSESRKSISWFLQRLPGKKASLIPDELCRRIHDSVQTMEKALQQYRFEELCVAFNGGKDCTLLLALLHAILERKGHHSKLKVLYILHNQPFPEVEEFIEQSARRYSLDIICIPGTIREALSNLKTVRSEVKAVLMGTRHTDPHSANLVAFSPTDSSWPEYMRINCILEWSYTDVWLFLRLFEIPYCKLYDQGYTSLDGREDTYPNPALLLVPTGNSNGSGSSDEDERSGRYSPAYLLGDEGLERAGRTQRT